MKSLTAFISFLIGGGRFLNRVSSLIPNRGVYPLVVINNDKPMDVLILEFNANSIIGRKSTQLF